MAIRFKPWHVPRPWQSLVMGAFVLVAITLAWAGSLDEFAKQHVGVALNRAMVTFATARTANALISVARSTTVSTPVIGGVTASPGQILAPLDELIEEFSALMLVASMSLAAQRILISLGSTTFVTALLTIALLSWAATQIVNGSSPRWLARLATILLFLRFAVPVAALASEAAYAAVMSSHYESAQAEVDSTSVGMLDRLADLKESVKALAHPLQVWRDVKEKVEAQIHHIVTLMAIFVLQTIVLPLAFIWAAYRIFGTTMTWRQTLNWPQLASASR